MTSLLMTTGTAHKDLRGRYAITEQTEVSLIFQRTRSIIHFSNI